MAHSFTGDDKFPDLSYDDDYRSYLISRRDSSGDYRFARTQMRRDRIRIRNAFRRVNGFLKTMIEGIANSKLRRMQRELHRIAQESPGADENGRYYQKTHRGVQSLPSCKQYASAGNRSHHVPYGWLSTDQRRSFFTTSRCVSSFCCVIAGSRSPIRSDSSHRASAN